MINKLAAANTQSKRTSEHRQHFPRLSIVLIACTLILLQSCLTDPYHVAWKSKDQAKLAEIATGPYNYVTRAMAVKRLTDTDQKTLALVAMHDPDYVVRGMAIEKLTDQDALGYVVLNDSLKENRLNAISKLNDQAVLNQFIDSTDEQELLMAAIARSSDQKTLIAIAHGEGRWSTEKKRPRWLPVREWDGRFSRSDGEFPEMDLRVAATRRLNQSLLPAIALTDKAWQVRYQATVLLKDREALLKVIDTYSNTQRKLAQLRLFLNDLEMPSHSPEVEISLYELYPTYQGYLSFSGAEGKNVDGEVIDMSLRYGDKYSTIINCRTEFPNSLKDRSVNFIPASCSKFEEAKQRIKSFIEKDQQNQQENTSG